MNDARMSLSALTWSQEEIQGAGFTVKNPLLVFKCAILQMREVSQRR